MLGATLLTGKGGLQGPRVGQWRVQKGNAWLISSQRPDICVSLGLGLRCYLGATALILVQKLLSNCLDTNTLALLLTQPFYVLLLLHGWDHLQTPIFHHCDLPGLLFSSPLLIQSDINLLSLFCITLSTGFSLQIKCLELNGALLPNMSTGNLWLWTYLEERPLQM